MDTHTHEEINGTVERVVYENLETGFRIFTLASKVASVTVTGCVPTLKAGQEVSVMGAWVTHPKFGKQFQAAQCIVSLPASAAGLCTYLSSGALKGIGAVYAQKLVTAFGDQVLEVIDKHPEKLKKVNGLGAKRIAGIIESWREQKAIAHIMVFLQDKGITPAYAYKIYKRYNVQAITIVQENPYRLAEEIWGIGFKIADQIAHQMGFDHHSSFRIQAGMLYAISQAIGSGHLYISIEDLKTTTKELLELTAPDLEHMLKESFSNLHAQGKIKIINHSDNHFVTTTQAYKNEHDVAQKIKLLLGYPPKLLLPIDAIYQKLRAQDGPIQLNEDQQRGIMAAIQAKITIITGGPGTGKTTLITQLLEILEGHRVRFKLAAPTGRAAKRMTESTRRSASTIHRLLEFEPAVMRFKYNEEHTLPVDVLIVDESSMIDIFLANALLKAVPLYAHVIFIGDTDQLPPVGAGNFLRDLIASGCTTCIKLTHIFRQAQHSLITVNAHRINSGIFPASALPETRKDFVWIKEEDPASITQHISQLLPGVLARNNIAAHETVVLTPMNRGIAGTHKLNNDLQQLLNGNQMEKCTFGLTEFRAGDRVMQIRNNYEKFIFNGDMGTLSAINREEQTVQINYGDRAVAYKYTELDEIVLAYAITVHKSQGSEYPAVIIPLFCQHFTLLARNLLYTAITRAKKLCIIIGQPKAIAIAIKNNKSIARKTFLKEFLTQEVTCL